MANRPCRFHSKAIDDWDKTGYILSLETKYGIPHSALPCKCTTNTKPELRL